jgi:hypothetical protein
MKTKLSFDEIAEKADQVFDEFTYEHSAEEVANLNDAEDDDRTWYNDDGCVTYGRGGGYYRLFGHDNYECYFHTYQDLFGAWHFFIDGEC